MPGGRAGRRRNSSSHRPDPAGAWSAASRKPASPGTVTGRWPAGSAACRRACRRARAARVSRTSGTGNSTSPPVRRRLGPTPFPGDPSPTLPVQEHGHREEVREENSPPRRMSTGSRCLDGTGRKGPGAAGRRCRAPGRSCTSSIEGPPAAVSSAVRTRPAVRRKRAVPTAAGRSTAHHRTGTTCSPIRGAGTGIAPAGST